MAGLATHSFAPVVIVVLLLLHLLQLQSVFVTGFVVTPPQTSIAVRLERLCLAAAKKNKNTNPNRTPEVIPELDPTDPQYQVSEEYSPNKESSWPLKSKGATLHISQRLALKAGEAFNHF